MLPKPARWVEPPVAHLSLYVGFEGHDRGPPARRRRTSGSTRDHRITKQNVRAAFASRHPRPFPRWCICRFHPRRIRTSTGRYPGHVRPSKPSRWGRTNAVQGLGKTHRGRSVAPNTTSSRASLSERLLETIHKHAPATRGKGRNRRAVYATHAPGTSPPIRQGEIYGLAHSTLKRYRATLASAADSHQRLVLDRRGRLFRPGLMGAMMGGMICSSAVLKGNAPRSGA